MLDLWNSLGKLRWSHESAQEAKADNSQMKDFWKFYTTDGKLIAEFSETFLVNPYSFLLVMSAHAYAWKMPYLRG